MNSIESKDLLMVSKERYEEVVILENSTDYYRWNKLQE